MYKEYLAEFWYSAKTLENSKVFFSTPTGGIYGKVGVNTFRNVIGAHYLPYSSEYVAPPSIDIMRPWFETIGYGEVVPAIGTLKKSLLPPRWSLANGINIYYDIIFWEDIIIKLNKKHREKVIPYTRFLSLLIMHKMKEGYGDGELTLYPTQISQWRLKLPSLLPMLRGFPKAQSLELNLDTRSIQLLQNNPLYTGMLKEDQQATASFIIHSESASGNDGSTTSTTKSDLGNSAPSTDPYVLADQTKSEETSNTVKLEDLSKLVSHVQPSFKDLDSPEDDLVIIVDDIDEDEDDEVHATENSQKHKLELEKNKAEVALLKAQPSFPNVEQLKELLVKSLKTEFSNILYAHDFSSSLPTKLKDLPSNLNELTEEVKGLKKQVHELEIELPGDLKEIPTKLDDFTKNVTSLTSQVAELKTLQWELLAEFLSLPA
ncbi:hypothetical protein Tco_0692008 [Tanacetum coccineum]